METENDQNAAPDFGGPFWVGDGPPPMGWAPIGYIVQNPVTGKHWITGDDGAIELVGGRVPISQFPKLFDVLVGAGLNLEKDDTTFALPDLRSRIVPAQLGNRMDSESETQDDVNEQAVPDFDRPDYTKELNKRFNYHQPSSEQIVNKHQQVREGCHYAANVIATACPEGREKALAFTKLEEAMMWANAAIARSQDS